MKNFTLLAVSKKLNSLKGSYIRLICLMLLVITGIFAGNVAKAQSFRTVTFTGNIADFQAAERFVSNNAAITYAIAFDATFMYFGVFNSGTFGNASDNLAIYLDTDPRNTLASGNGTTGGRAYSGVTPSLPFNADYSSYTEQSYTDPLNRFNASWGSTGVIPTTFNNTSCREVRIALSDLGNPASVYVTMWMGFSGGIFGNAPGTAVSGATPAITGYFGSFPVYRTGIQPVSFRAQNTSTANGGGTAISNFSLVGAGNITAGDFGDITLTSAASTTATMLGNTSFTGTLNIGTGTSNATKIELAGFTMFAGGRGIGGTAGVLSLNGSSGTVVTASSASIFSFLGAGSINGANTTKLMPSGLTMTLGGAVDFFAAGSIRTIFGTGSALQINTNGTAITNAPTYNTGSTLVYNAGATAGLEWTTGAASGVGVPQAVTIQNNSAVNFGTSNAFRQANGLVTIGSGSSLTMSSVFGGDLRIAAGLTNNNAGAGVGINTSAAALTVAGTSTYTKAGTDNIGILAFATASTLTLASGTNLLLNNTSASGCLQFNAAGTLAIGANTVSLASGTTVGGTTSGTISGATPTTSILSLLGTTTWAGTAATVISVATTVGLQINGGLSVTTAGRLSVGYLQINQGGFVNNANSPVVYPASGTLVYNHSAGTYGVQALEWPATSGPTNVTLFNNGGSGISFGNNDITARTIAGTLTLNAGQNLSLTGTGTPNLTVLNTIAAANAVISGTGTYTQTVSGSFTTANTGGINGTLTTSGAVTLPATTSFTFNNATASQVTGALMPTTIQNLTINNTAVSTGTTISSNTLLINGTTTLTAGALVLPTAGGNLVTMTGALSAVTGTITGSATSNLTNTGGASTSVGFTSGGTALNNWTVTTGTFGSSSTVGLSSVVTINGTFSLASAGVPDIYTTSTGGLTFLSGATYTDNATTGNRVLGAGSFTLQSGSNFRTGASTGLNATASLGAIQITGTRTFSGGANYVFNNASTAQGIGDAIDGTAGTGKTGAITGSVTNSNTNATSGLTLNPGTTITITSPGTFNVGITSSTSSILTAPANSIISGTGTINMFGNGATSGSTLITANATGVNGTFATTTTNLTNGANNNTNFTFNGLLIQQVTGALLPATVSNLNFQNTFSGALATPSVTLSSSVTTTGTITFSGGTSPAGVVSIGAGNTLTINGILTLGNSQKLISTSTSNLTIGGSGTITANSLFFTGGGAINNFTMNRTGVTVLVGDPLTVSGTYSSTAGVISMSANTLTLNGPIVFGAATLTATGPFAIGGTGTITGSLLGTTNPLAFSAITMNRASTALTLGSNVSVSNATGLTLTAGNITLGSFNLTSTGTQLGAGSTTSMVVATGSGQAFNTFAIGATAAKTFPIGDGTNYTPVVLTFSANTVAGTVGVKTTASIHPNINTGSTPVVSISRFWTFTNTSLTSYTYSGTFRYISPGDVTGTEANLKLSRWNNTAWTEFSGSSVASPVLSSGSLTQATGPLSLDYTGRTDNPAISYTWNGSSSSDWATGANWTPSGVPTAIDNITINVPGTNTLSINSARSIANFTLNGTGTFTTTSAGTLTISGTTTYANTASATLDQASTVIITSASSQTVPALNYGNLNLTGGNRTLPDAATVGSVGISGTYTPGAGTITITGSTVNFNGSGAQTIPATNFNNLTSSSSGARTLANSGTVTVAGTFTPGSNTFTVTGSTVAFTATTGTIAVTLPTVASGNSFNTLTINGTGGVFALPYSATTQNVATTLNVTAGTFVINPASSSSVNTISVGTININGGTLDDRSTGSGTTTNLQVTTAWNQTSGVVTNTGNGVGKIVFTGGGATTFTGLTAAASFKFFGVQVANNTTTTLASALTVNNVSGNSISVDAGSIMVGGTFLVSTNAAGNSFIINGTYKTAVLAGFSGTATSALSSTNSPTVTLGSASTIEYTSAGTSPVITGRSDYANVIVSGSSSTFTFNGTSTLSGNYNQSAGTVGLTTSASVYNFNVGGNFVMTNGTFNVLTSTAATTATTVTVTGNTTTSGTASIALETVSNTNADGIGIFQTTDFTSTSTGTIVEVGATGTYTNNEFRIRGNLSKSGTGTFNIQSTGNFAGGIVFNKAGTQTFSYTGTASGFMSYSVNSGSTLQMTTGIVLGSGNNPYSNFTVNTGATIDMGTSVISGGNATVIAANTGFTLATGATMITANTGGVAASITNLTKNFTADANYEFNAGTAQSTGFSALTLGAPNSITVSGSGTLLTPDINITFGNSATLNVNSGNALVAAATRTFTFGTGGIVNINGTLQTANTTASGALTGSATSTIVNTNTPTFNTNTSTSTIEFNGVAAQFINSRTYGNVKISNGNVVNMGGTVTVSQTLNLNTGDININGNSLVLNGPVTRTSGNIRGSITSNLTANATAGSLFFGSTGTQNYLKTFTIGASGSATLGNALNITAWDGVSTEGVLTVTSGGTLASAGFLAIKSDNNGTARIAAGSTSGGYITGNVSVERYIRQNSSKGWRLLASNTSGQSINAGWQEGQAALANLNTGFGTMITAGNALGYSLSTAQSNGFDQLSSGVSLFKYNPVTDGLEPVTVTGSGNIAAEQGYYIFIRGDRSAGQFGGGSPTTATVLRSKGSLFLGNQAAVSTGTPGYALVRNPYPSRIDMRNIVRAGLLVDAFQVWDSKLGGSFGVGAYQTFAKSGADYVVAPGGGSYGTIGSVQNFIESGAAFFIQSSGGTGSAQVTEACKTSASSNASFRPATPTAGEAKVAFSLFANNATSVDAVDGGLAFFNNDYSNAVDINDVRKNGNFNENFGIVRDNVQLVVERRQQVSSNDTLFFSMNQLRPITYRLDIQATDFDAIITTAVLEDKYTTTNTTLDLSILNSYSFTVDANAASKAADRFRLVFRQSSVVPVSFVSVRAAQAGNNIAVEWKVANEINTARYEVEKSTDGRNFSKKGTIVASGSSTYNWLDENVVTGYNYYRIKSVDNNGVLKYTQVVKVQVGGKAGIAVSPNPIQGNFVNLQFTQQQEGRYGIQITNIAGQVVYNRQVQHNGGSASQSFVLPSALITGIYQLQVIAPDNSKHTEKLIISQGN